VSAVLVQVEAATTREEKSMEVGKFCDEGAGDVLQSRVRAVEVVNKDCGDSKNEHSQWLLPVHRLQNHLQ
jgi:hypothetical protein